MDEPRGLFWPLTEAGKLEQQRAEPEPQPVSNVVYLDDYRKRFEE